MVRLTIDFVSNKPIKFNNKLEKNPYLDFLVSATYIILKKKESINALSLTTSVKKRKAVILKSPFHYKGPKHIIQLKTYNHSFTLKTSQRSANRLLSMFNSKVFMPRPYKIRLEKKFQLIGYITLVINFFVLVSYHLFNI